jgi:large subunit ribosomal protein L18
MEHRKVILRRKKRLRYALARAAKGRPRLSVFRSGRHIAAQIIDDAAGKTLVSVSSLEKSLNCTKPAVVESSRGLGKILGERALEKGLRRVIFDKGAYAYHGRVKALAEGAREGGLDF